MNSHEFLTALWGGRPPGFVQIWELHNRRSAYYETTHVNFDGAVDVFTAVCTTARRHGAGQRAKADQTAALAGLFLDLDVGRGKFDNRTQALSFANKYARPTITVDSGSGGVHAWYLFPEPWVFRSLDQRARAKIIVQQWVAVHQVAAAERHVQIDSVGDLARILRLPGTLNGKTDPPLPVHVIEGEGPRHTYSELAKHLSHMPIIQPTSGFQSGGLVPVDLTADATDFEAKLDALLENSPEFMAVWSHQRRMPDDSPSSYDMSLCNLAAGAMNDGELRLLIQAHRAKWADWCAEHDAAERRPDGYSQAKGRRESYLVKTIASARRAEQRARLDGLGRRRAA